MTDKLKLAAAQAQQLRIDPAFIAATQEARQFALEALMAIKPSDTQAIRDAQARVHAIDDLDQALASAIIRGHDGRKTSVA